MPAAILEVLGEWALRSTALVSIAVMAMWVFRVKDANVCSSVWTAVTVGTLLLPIASAVAPQLPVPFPWLTPTADAVGGRRVSMDAFVSIREGAPAAGRPGSGHVAGNPASLPSRSRRPDWQTIAVVSWAAVASFMLFRLAVGLWLGRKLARKSRRIQNGIHESAHLSVPVTVGLFRPVVLLPPDWRNWGQPRFEAVVAHELAHVERYDPLRLAVACLYRGLCWFHPLAWWLHTHVAEFAEAASDDAALRMSLDRRGYAEMLLGFFERAPQRVSLEGTAMSSGGRVTSRFERVLDSSRKLAVPLTRGGAATLLVAVSAFVLLISSVRPVWAVSPPTPAPRAPVPPAGALRTVAATAVPVAKDAGQKVATNDEEVKGERRFPIRKTLTLSQDGLLALDVKSSSLARAIKATPRGKGVDYEILFTGSPASVTFASRVQVSGADHFALRFTLLSSTPGPDAYLSVGALVNQRRANSAYTPVRLGGAGVRTAVSETRTDAETVKLVGFTVYIAPHYAEFWPTSEWIVRLRVEPLPVATEIKGVSDIHDAP
jgi:hypothetical protein